MNRARAGQHPMGQVVLLALLSTMGPFTVDTFFPSLRAISQHFGVSLWQTQQLLTAYMLPYACMSLVHGSLSDALGRRTVMLWALAVYVLASLGCALAASFALLLCARFLQGVVAGAGQIVSRAIVRDRYQGAEAQRMMSIIAMIFSVGPALAPIVGGWVHVLFGWRAVFGFMVLFGTALGWAAWLHLPETHPPSQRTRLHIVPMLRSNAQVMTHPEFLALASACGFGFVCMHIYLGCSPAIVLDHWHLTETDFYALMIPMIGGFTLGAALSGKLAGKLQPASQAGMGFLAMLAIALLMVLMQRYMHPAPLYLQQLDLAALALGVQLMFPVVTLRILDLFPNARGAAASAQSFIGLIFAAVAVGMFAPLLVKSMLNIAWAVCGATAVAWLLWQVSTGRRRAAHAVHAAG